MDNVDFRHDFGEIVVSITGPRADAKVEVRGPREYTERMDWGRIHDKARLFANFSDSAEMALALAVQMDYAAWHGQRATLRALR